MADQTADIEWRDGAVPVSTRFDDPYYSLEDGLAEARHVFLGGNDLPGRFHDGFHIAELGFGTGLNFLSAAQAWVDAGRDGVLHFTSFEAFPVSPEVMATALAAFPALGPHHDALQAFWADGRRSGDVAPGLSLSVIVGDARQTLRDWDGRADAWFLDGFAPAKNPELWGPDLMAEVARHTAPGGSAASYTAAGHVRRALAEAGFTVDRRPGYGRKRHMTIARMPQ